MRCPPQGVRHLGCGISQHVEFCDTLAQNLTFTGHTSRRKSLFEALAGHLGCSVSSRGKSVLAEIQSALNVWDDEFASDLVWEQLEKLVLGGGFKSSERL